MNYRHLKLIGLYSTKYSIRGGVGLVFLLLCVAVGVRQWSPRVTRRPQPEQSESSQLEAAVQLGADIPAPVNMSSELATEVVSHLLRS